MRLITGTLQRLSARLLHLIVRPTVIGRHNLHPGTTTYYVLEQQRHSHRLLLQKVLEHQLPLERILYAHADGQAPLRDTLHELARTQHSNPALDILLVPVTIFHGRLPEREDSWLNLLYAETWHRAGPVGRMLQLLVNGRETLLQVSRPLRLQALVEAGQGNHATVARKAARVLRSHFQIKRRAIIGPDLSHRRTLMYQVLRHPDVQQALTTQAASRGESRAALEQEALRALDRIAADFSPLTVRLLNPLFNRVWRRLYRSVKIVNIEAVQAVAGHSQLVYLPCHRSHMDYLLLSWALYREGLMLPHVAAGDNLNIPVIGPILKRGGAIFMRRSFQGDPVYTALYKAYLEKMSHHGHALEYFIEGGRSRSGRLLPAKTGLLGMTLEGYRNAPSHPVSLIPVWIGYDRLVESDSYQRELSGAGKKEESLAGVLRTLRILQQKFGHAYLSFGEPIALAPAPVAEPRAQVRPLAVEVLRRINRAATPTHSSLLATVMLAAPRQTLPAAELLLRSDELKQLLAGLPQHNGLHLAGSVRQWVDAAMSMQQLSRDQQQIYLSTGQAREMTFYRNNILHLLVLPGLYLLLCHRLGPLPSQSTNRIIKLLYPYLDAELVLPWAAEQFTPILRQIRDHLSEQGLLRAQGRYWQAPDSALGQLLMLTVEPLLLRYYLLLRVLYRYGEIGREDLIDSTRQLAAALHQIYGFSSPEYADGKVINAFVDQLLAQGLLNSREQRLSGRDDPGPLFRHARRILRPHLVTLVDEKLGDKP